MEGSSQKRDSASTPCQMDACPVEVIGNILSQVADGRSVRAASRTCRTWREAARHHVERLSFDLRMKGSYKSYNLDQVETEITEMVMDQLCLRELSIYGREEGEDASFNTGHVMAWFLHTKGTLTHLTFLAHVKSKKDVLTILAMGGNNVLKRLVCSVRGLDPFVRLAARTHSLPSLVSLTLAGDECKHPYAYFDDLQQLYWVCPKLESLTIINMTIVSQGSCVFTIPPLLRVLNLERVGLSASSGSGSLDLQPACNLESLSLNRVSVATIEFGIKENLQRLHLVNCGNVRGITFAGILPALLDLTLARSSRLISQILPKVGTELRKLTLDYSGSNGLIDMKMIASSSPRLLSFSLHYECAYIYPLAKLERVSILELSTSMDDTDHESFAQWVVRVLDSCPRAKKLTILLGDLTLIKTIESQRFASRVASHLISLMRPYADVDIKIQM